VEKELARITALGEEDIKLELLRSQLDDIRLFLSQGEKGFGEVFNYNFLTWENLRVDCPQAEVREAGITFRVVEMRQRS